MSSFVSTFESQTLNSVVTGFSFAAAIAWMDVARWIIANFGHISKSSGSYTVLTALLTTLLTVVTFFVVKMINNRSRQQ